MREERKNPNAELNEATLENVSGGVGFSVCHDKAMLTCSKCPLHASGACDRSSDLLDYLLDGNYYSVHVPSDCPFYTK